MENKIKVNDKTSWFAEELRLAELHEDFMGKYAIECNDDKGREWYAWKDVDSPQDIWEMWIEPRIKLVNVDQRVKPESNGITEANDNLIEYLERDLMHNLYFNSEYIDEYRELKRLIERIKTEKILK